MLGRWWCFFENEIGLIQPRTDKTEKTIWYSEKRHSGKKTAWSEKESRIRFTKNWRTEFKFSPPLYLQSPRELSPDTESRATRKHQSILVRGCTTSSKAYTNTLPVKKVCPFTCPGLLGLLAASIYILFGLTWDAWLCAVRVLPRPLPKFLDFRKGKKEKKREV